MLGGILSASAMATIFDSCVAPAEGDVWTPDFLSVEEGKMVTRIADILIPTTDTPGAVDALVPQFLDRFFGNYITKDEQEFTRKGFAYFDEECQKANGKSFLKCSNEDQLAFLQKEEKNFIDEKIKDDRVATFFGEIKRLVYQGFFNSEEGATEVLMYDPVPGNYDGCIPYSDVNGTWATS